MYVIIILRCYLKQTADISKVKESNNSSSRTLISAGLELSLFPIEAKISLVDFNLYFSFSSASDTDRANAS